MRDQLLKAGLVSKKQLQKNRPKKRRDKRQQVAEQSEAERQRQAELRAIAEDKKARDRELNAQRERQRKAQDDAQWARQIAAAHALEKQPAAEGEPAFHFAIGGKIHQVYVAAKQRDDLGAGRLGLFHFDGKYHLLPAEQARRIHDRLGRRVWLADLVESSSDEEVDDAYAEYQVPDDLMW